MKCIGQNNSETLLISSLIIKHHQHSLHQFLRDDSKRLLNCGNIRLKEFEKIMVIKLDNQDVFGIRFFNVFRAYKPSKAR
jgi:hypothetical protein